MTGPKQPPLPPEPDWPEDVPPQAEQDESVWHAQVLDTHVKPENPKLARALEAARRRAEELAHRKKGG
jgi:hypothetical protein